MKDMEGEERVKEMMKCREKVINLWTYEYEKGGIQLNIEGMEFNLVKRIEERNEDHA